MCILEKLNFKIFRGYMPPDPPSVLAPSAFDPILAGPTLNCFHRACTVDNLHKFFLASVCNKLDKLLQNYYKRDAKEFIKITKRKPVLPHSARTRPRKRNNAYSTRVTWTVIGTVRRLSLLYVRLLCAPFRHVASII